MRMFRLPFFNRGQIRREVDAEVRFHLDARVAELIALGHKPEDAKAQARAEFGNVDEVRSTLRAIDEQRDRRRDRGEWLASLWRDVAYAARTLRRSPGVAVAVALTLALGLGVNLAIFSFLNVVFVRPPAGVGDPGAVRRVWTEIQFRSGPQFWSGFSYPEYAAARRALGDSVETALYRPPETTRYGRDGAEAQVRTSVTNAEFFNLLRVRPMLGRFFAPEEGALDAAARVAVASEDFWRRSLGADSAAIGRDVYLAGRPYTLIGVAGDGFTGVELDGTDLWIPFSSLNGRFDPRLPWWQNNNINGFQILLRPRANAGVVGTDAVLERRIALGLRSPEALQRPADTANVVRVGSIIRAQGPGRKEQEVTIATRIAGVTVLVLLIACANVVNLLLARAVSRRREIAVRLAMGVSRARLMRLLLAESVLLGLIASAAAVIAAFWGGALLRSILLPDVHWTVPVIDWRIMALALAAGVGVGIGAGFLPSLQAANTNLTDALKAGAGDGHARRSRVRAALVMTQAALSVVLLFGAALFVLSLGNVRDLRTGYDVPQLIFGSVHWDAPDPARDARQAELLREAAERLRQAPGVEDVALARMAPTRGFSTVTFYPDVDTLQYRKPFATYNLVSPEFFSATGSRVLRGRDFPRGMGRSMPPVVIVNDAMAQAQWPGMDAVGRCMRFALGGTCYTVIGVVETALWGQLLEKPQPQYYLPVDNPPDSVDFWLSSIVVRSAPGARTEASAALARVIREVFPGGRPGVATMEQYVEPEYRPWRLGALLFTSLGLLALIVASLGFYSTVAYTVAQRTREFGVRSALGARAPDIVRQVVWSVVKVAVVGIAAGVVLALAAGRFVASLLYGVSPGDPGVLVGVSLTLLAVAAAAALAPGWRAARVDPAIALQSE